jgi:hypothetical protein
VHLPGDRRGDRTGTGTELHHDSWPSTGTGRGYHCGQLPGQLWSGGQ